VVGTTGLHCSRPTTDRTMSREHKSSLLLLDMYGINIAQIGRSYTCSLLESYCLVIVSYYKLSVIIISVLGYNGQVSILSACI
jgi:predicted glycosyltransferase